MMPLRCRGLDDGADDGLEICSGQNCSAGIEKSPRLAPRHTGRAKSSAWALLWRDFKRVRADAGEIELFVRERHAIDAPFTRITVRQSILRWIGDSLGGEARRRTDECAAVNCPSQTISIASP